MKKQKSGLQQIGKLLNTSSETFMLIALIGLFALPFVIAKNLEPAVKQAETTPRNTARIISNSDNQVAVAPTAVVGPDVLGVQTAAVPFMIEEDSINLRYFQVVDSELAAKDYALTVKSDQVFGKIPVFKLKNPSSESATYQFTIKNNILEQEAAKYLYAGRMRYEAGSPTLPGVVKLDPNEEVVFSLMSNESRPTDVTVTVNLIQ